MPEQLKKESDKKESIVKKIEQPKKLEQPQKPIIKPSMNFAEFKMKLSPEWAAALKVYSNVKHDMEEKPKEEWEKLYKEMLKS